ncbi:MAG: hypothetical protein A2329_07350 [Sulfurimonas sp. RIFOXYB2_FULL_37_5]|uniref:hypothetical protein n=1 Tax=Sulfurimonas sp. RIFOXYB12_FULL_35_9 TaxID=1802256 RepID=UPI0008C29118|nr:hypothetical protein [Sulfurimonas sp. RIFOXYB12_FULL_35_9]OHE04518.1 MAG: hypothetical protein A2345_02425 [Sulfurimonas sp. RIFOXYB12_FULL_35_9]OHE12643.1 MAG: hypothetical protein A2329_07350 [Sulfurimonas sp. RIFOXYB2_FULL_37_5]
MFDFLDSDWFIISLEIVFLLFIAYDAKKYFETKKKEYITNIVLTLGFFIWAFIPFYNSYMTWSEDKKHELISECKKENNETLCQCLDEKIFKEYSFEDFKSLDKNSSDFNEFIKETKEECLDDSWF